MRTILVSVWDKTGLEHFLKGVQEYGEVRLIGTRSTSKFLEEKGFKCEAVEELTKFPEILDGRVKTLHPAIFGGLLARPDVPSDVMTMKEHQLPFFDLMICNLYPFEEYLEKKAEEGELIEGGGDETNATTIGGYGLAAIIAGGRYITISRGAITQPVVKGKRTVGLDYSSIQAG